MKVFVTGASGFVGQHLVRRLLQDRYRVMVLIHKEDLMLRDALLSQIRGDLLRAETLRDKLDGVEVVFHLVGLYRGSPEDLVQVNTLTTVNLLQEALKSGVKKFIYAAAGAAYGEPINGKPFTEEVSLRPDTIYGLTKMWAEETVDYFARIHGLVGINLRFPNIYGPGNTVNVIFKFLQSIQKEGKVIVLGDGLQERDFLYIEDVLDGFLRALACSASDVFNLASGEVVNLLVIAATLGSILGREIPIEFKQAEQGVVKRLWLDNRKAREVLSWHPKTDLRRGLEETVEWYQETYGKI